MSLTRATSDDGAATRIAADGMITTCIIHRLISGPQIATRQMEWVLPGVCLL